MQDSGACLTHPAQGDTWGALQLGRRTSNTGSGSCRCVGRLQGDGSDKGSSSLDCEKEKLQEMEQSHFKYHYFLGCAAHTLIDALIHSMHDIQGLLSKMALVTLLSYHSASRNLALGFIACDKFYVEHPPVEKNTDRFDTLAAYLTQSAVHLYSTVIPRRACKCQVQECAGNGFLKPPVPPWLQREQRNPLLCV